MLAVIALLLIIPSMLWDGFAMTRLWHWFIVSQFHVHELTWLGAIGLAMTARYVTVQHDTNYTQDTDSKLIRAIAYSALKPLLALAFGGCVHYFMVML